MLSNSTVHRVLSSAGLLSRFSKRPSKKGNGFVQPLVAHQHWHIDVSPDDMLAGKQQATPVLVITAPSRCRRQVQRVWRFKTPHPASATCLWPQCDKSRGLGAEPPRTPSSCLFTNLL